MKFLLALAAVLLGGTFAYADDISLGTPGYGGNGCPDQSVSATLSPDSKALSLLFDAYQVNAGGSSGHSFDRKSCNVAIPVHVPQGLSVSVLAIDYRGFNHLPATGQGLPDFQSVDRAVDRLVAVRRRCQPQDQFEHPRHHDQEPGSHGDSRYRGRDGGHRLQAADAHLQVGLIALSRIAGASSAILFCVCEKCR